MIGIAIKWECPSCGSILKTYSPYWTKKQRKDVSEPEKCGCSRVSGFKILSFAPCEFNVEVTKNEN